MNNLKFIDLFAGIGGFRIALEEMGAECVFSSEWDKQAKITYETNFKDTPHGDITEIDESDIPNHDILAAGFPCQPFSISGKRLGFKDTRGTLFFDVARIIKYHNPKLVILENVRNFASHDNGNTLAVVKKTLEDFGYNVFYKVLNASDYGLPQNRKRIFIICFRNDLKINDFEFPGPTDIKISLNDVLIKDEKNTKYIIDRPDIYFDEKKIESTKMISKLNKPIRIGTINKGGQGERIYSVKGHAITLSAYGGGAGAKTGAYLIDNQVRKLTPRECARIQGFPDSFIIPVTDGQAWKQFGNSIPINILRSILNKIDQEKILNREPKEFIKPKEKYENINLFDFIND